MDQKQIDFYRKGAKEGFIDDSSNPLFTFQQTSADILVKLATGKFDALELVKIELNNRGLDETGKFVGFKPKTSPDRLEASKKAQAKKKKTKVNEQAKTEAHAQ